MGAIVLMPVWVLGCVLLVAFAPTLWRAVELSGILSAWIEPHGVGPRTPGPGSIAPVFTREVRYWGGDIDRWAADHAVDANLLATLIQIESCGHPLIASPSDARGLFQVMPYHFAPGEDAYDPETNALRGVGVLRDCLDRAGSDVGRAMACYNGGPGTIGLAYEAWSQETRDYYTWATGIYADVKAGRAESDTLQRWLAAGGASLCRRAAGSLGLE